MYQSNRSLNTQPPGHIPGIWRVLLPGREGIWWTKSSPGRGIWSLLIWGGEFDRYSFDFMLRRADSTWRDKSWRRQALMHSKRKIPDSWRTGWKARLAQALLCIWRYWRTICIIFSMYQCCLLNHVYLHSFRSIIEATEKFPGVGHLITWNGAMMGHLNSFLASGWGKFSKNFPKIQMPGGLPGGDV